MKRLALVLTALFAATAFAFPAYAMGGAMGGGMSGGMGGGGMMGHSGSGLLDWFQKWRNGDQYGNPAGQDKEQMEALDRQHQEDSAYLKYQILMKEKQLDALLESEAPDMEKVRTLHRAIRELRAEAEQEQHRYEQEAGNLNRGYLPGNADGRRLDTALGGSGNDHMTDRGNLRNGGERY